jgi:hypothetical protein
MEVSDSVAHIPLLGSQSHSCDFLPDVKSVLHFLPIGGSGKTMPPQTKMLRDRPIGGKEPLGLTGRLKALHAPLALPSRLVESSLHGY